MAIVLFASIAWAGSSTASLVGQGDWVLDTNTNLQWLNLELTQYDPDKPIVSDFFDEVFGYSVDEILAGGGGFLADGWRYATTSEMCGLLAAYAGAPTCPGQQSHPDTDASGLRVLMWQLGITWADNEVSTTGYFDDGDPTNGVGLATFWYENYGQPISAGSSTVRLDYGSSSATNSGALGYSAPKGHFLVRSIPEPGTGLMIGLGLVAIARQRAPRRRARATRP